MTIEEFFRMLLRNAVLLIVVTLLSAGAGLAYSFSKPEVYQASALGFVVGAAGAGESIGGDQQSYSAAQFFLPLFNTRPVGEAIKESTGSASSPEALAGSLFAGLDPNAPIITVTARAGTPEEAQAIANASLDAVAAEAAELDGSYSNRLQPYVLANQPTSPIEPSREKYILAGAAIGFVLAMALAWLRNRNDSRVRTVDDIKATVDVPALGVLPETKDLSRGKDGLLPDPSTFQSREALRKLRTNLQFVNVDNPPRSIVVTSSAPGEGKSTVSGNLARVMARAGVKTVLVDADLRRPMVATEFGVDGTVGLSQLLAGTVSIDDVLHPLEKGRLLILPAGQIPPNPSELLGSRRMSELIADLSREFFVIMDAPPVLAVTDAQLLSRQTDGALLVAVPGRTRVEGLTRAVDSIHGVGGSLLGVVMNRASTSRLNRIAYGDAEYGYSSYGYSSYGKKGYGYGYSSASSDVPEDEAAVPEPATPVASTSASAPVSAPAAAPTNRTTTAATQSGEPRSTSRTPAPAQRPTAPRPVSPSAGTPATTQDLGRQTTGAGQEPNAWVEQQAAPRRQAGRRAASVTDAGEQ